MVQNTPMGKHISTKTILIAVLGLILFITSTKRGTALAEKDVIES